MDEKFNDVKQKRDKLKTDIEALLTNFRNETGYTPLISVETNTKKTNDREIVWQKVGVTITVQ